MVIEPVFTGELVIGRFYSVPTVKGNFLGRVDDWPVLGPMHEDSAIIDFPHDHYHFDFRFFGSVQWKLIRRQELPVFAFPLIPRVDYPELGPVIFRRRRCCRVMPRFPRVKWLTALEAAYADAALKPGMICPHRGASLRGLPVVDGCVTCPLHGLRWNIETGKLVPEGS